jgi:hypothetical protein
MWYKDPNGDDFMLSKIEYEGQIGDYDKTELGPDKYAFNQLSATEGQSYHMKHDEIHSMEFTPGAAVLIIEGPTMFPVSHIIEPIVDDRVIPTLKTEPWMFS